MAVVGFPLWDAAGIGAPWLGGVSTEWSRGELHTVTLARCRGEPRDDVADISVSTSKPGWSATPHEALTIGALLAFSPRLTAATGLTAREAARRLVDLSRSPGLPVSLTVDGIAVDARRHEAPVTGDWAVTAVGTRLPVCVAGRGGLAVPELAVADPARWAAPLRAQIAEAARR